MSEILRDDIYEIEVGGQTFLSIFGKFILPVNRIREIDLDASNAVGREKFGITNCVLITMDFEKEQNYHADTIEAHKYYFNYEDADALRHFFNRKKK